MSATATDTMAMTMTMGGMSHETTAAMSDMSSMSGMMGMSNMAMVFFTANNTPLWSPSFIPTSDGQYAGVCIFLIALSAIFRALLAVRCHLLRIYDRVIATRHTKLVTTKEPLEGCTDCPRPWRVNEAAIQALFDTVLAGIGYLLMLAVMTMNVGYYLSVLGGVFLGSFIFGRWTGASIH